MSGAQSDELEVLAEAFRIAKESGDEKNALKFAEAIVALADAAPQDAGPSPVNDWQGTAADLDPTSGMSGFEKFRAGWGQGGANLARGAGQALGLVDQDEIAEAQTRDQALLDTGAGATGSVFGMLAPLLATAFIPGANTVTGSAAIGGTAGLLQPIAEGSVLEGKLGNAAEGAALAGGVTLGARGLHSLWNAGKGLIDPFRTGGQEAIAGRVLRRFATDSDDALRSIDAATPPVPGYQSTLAEVTQDPGLASLQRTVMNTPDGARVIGEADRANAGLLKGLLSRIAGDDVTREAAVVARRQASNPLYSAAAASDKLADPSRTVRLIDRILEAHPANKAVVKPLQDIRETLFESYPIAERGRDAWRALDDVLGKPNTNGLQGFTALKEARTIMSRVKRGDLAADEALSALRGISVPPRAAKTVTDALDLAKQYLKTPEFVLRQEPRHIMSAIDNIKALLANPENKFAAKQLLIVKRSLEHQLKKVAPEFAQAERAFAQGSRPINQMDVGRGLLEKLSPALDDFAETGGLRGAMYAGALRNGERFVESATGRARPIASILDPAQMETVEGVGRALAGRTSAQNLARPAGTNTIQNLAGQDLLRQIAGPTGMPKGFVEAAVMPTLMRPANFLLQAQEPKILELLSKSITDPNLAAKLMRAGVPREMVGPLIQAASRHALVPGLLTADAAQQ